jgi:YesN/AraC family two-component response regulator
VLALKEFKTKSYDLVILDIKMPKMDGFDLYDKLDHDVKICFDCKEIYREKLNILV